MGIVKLGLLLIIAAMIQVVGARYVRWLMYLDGALVITIYYARQGNKIVSPIVGVLSGLVQDSLTGLPLGINAFSKTLIGYGVAAFSRKFVLDNRLTQLAVLFVSAYANVLIVFGLFYLIEWKYSPVSIKQVVLQSLITSILGLSALALLDRRSSKS